MILLGITSVAKRFCVLSAFFVITALVAQGEADATQSAETNGHKLLYDAMNAIESDFRKKIEEDGADAVRLFKMASSIIHALDNQAYCESVSISKHEAQVYQKMLKHVCRHWDQPRISDLDFRRAYVLGYFEAMQQLALLNYAQDASE